MMIWSRVGVSADPMEMLWRYATGAMPLWVGEEGKSPLGWVKFTHRGVQWLDRVCVPKKRKPEVFSKRFELRIDHAFDEVVAACADTARNGFTWIVPQLAEAYSALHRMGFAHSFEAWEDGQLAGGMFGLQLGGIMTMESCFHRVSDAGKPAIVRGMLHLRDRGFKLIDISFVSDHLARWGAEWMPQHEYDRLLLQQLQRSLSVTDDISPPQLPWAIRARLPLLHLSRVARQRGMRLRDRCRDFTGFAHRPAGLPAAGELRS